MTRPSDVSEAGWEFACDQWPSDKVRTSMEASHVDGARRSIAHAFDAAAKPLREEVGAMVFVLGEIEKHMGMNPTGLVPEGLKTLARFTPESS